MASCPERREYWIPPRDPEGPPCFRSAASYCDACALWKRTYVRPEQEADIESNPGAPVAGFLHHCPLPDKHPDRCDGQFALKVTGPASAEFYAWFQERQWDDPKSPEDFDLPGVAP